MILRVTLWLVLTVALALAAGPIASVGTSDTLSLNGVSIAPAGVPSWPLVAGDTLATSGAPAVILFQDKTRLTLEKNSRVKLDREGGHLLVRLLEGALAYRLTPGSQLRFANLGRPAMPQGTLSLVGDKLVSGAPGTASVKVAPPPPPPPISWYR